MIFIRGGKTNFHTSWQELNFHGQRMVLLGTPKIRYNRRTGLPARRRKASWEVDERFELLRPRPGM